MSNEIIIKLENISKMYKIFDSRSDQLLDALNVFGRSFAREFWALKDINFEIIKGSTVGILGQNGSGKSTLLQLITAVLQPTSGKISVTGRVAALLELGAGFNPSLSGRENVIMNGMVMGLTKNEITEKMELIQRFADIGDFFDQPMRIYSSGMFMRVAFSAAIHADPDILIIDEALSVGDAKFQEKCFRRFRDFQEAGKTIILVTHDRSAVPRLCDVALLLHKGRLIEFGTPKRIVDLYSNILATGDIIEYENAGALAKSDQKIELELNDKIQVVKPNECRLEEKIRKFLENKDTEDRFIQKNSYNKNEYRYGDKSAAIIDYMMMVDNKTHITTIQCGEILTVHLKIYFHVAIENPLVGMSIRDTQGVLIYGLNSAWSQYKLPKVFAGEVCCYKFTIAMNLRVGAWFLEFAVASSQSALCDVRSNAVQLDVLGGIKSFDGLVYLESTLEVA
jgi:lipopolysaccharide transport system ATP-binding protein